MRIIFLFFLTITQLSFGQDQPINGVKSSAPSYYLLKDADVFVTPNDKITKTAILIKDDKIIAIGNNISKPKGTVELNYEGKTILPAFVELNSSLGMSPPSKSTNNNSHQLPEKDKNGNYYWNQAIQPEFIASENLVIGKDDAKLLQKLGYGFALAHSKNGIVRGNGTFVSLENETKKSSILVSKASNHFSFEKGTSKQSYPSSQMGSIALVRQFLYDADWYEKQVNKTPNLSIDAYLETKKLPFVFDTKESQEILRAEKIAKEFGLNFHYFGNGNEYQHLKSFKDITGYVILPLSFPKAFDVHDPYLNREIPLSALKHWELAPSNPYLLVNNGNKICFSAEKCENEKEFWSNIKKTIARGLTVEQVLAALTINPAKLLQIDDKVGTIEKDKFASFNVYSSNPFTSDAQLMEQWQMGNQTVIIDSELAPINGVYNLVIDGTTKPIEISQKSGKYTAKYEKSKTGIDKEVFINVEGNDIILQFNDSISGSTGSVNLHGKINPKLGVMEGEGSLPSGKWIKWSAVKQSKGKAEPSSNKPLEIDSSYQSKIWFPTMAFGFDTLPKQETFIIKNVTAWTNESEGILKDATVIIEKGKIAFVGTGGFKHPQGAIEIDGKGMHLTSGIIDEHSHIAISKGVNEGGQAVAAEVSIADVVNSNDINIYRQLAGGVTTSQLLHGSADPIGGQSAIIKLKWGLTADELLLPDAPKFIKFALGENVKQSNWGDFQTTRFPQTRMGVEQVYVDAFTRAKIYEQEWNNHKQSKTKGSTPRRDLELDILVEILNKERNITCHSYIQSEINMLMHVADTFGFKINTFTHILEGYKVADKMAKHGAGGSTFADWWAYKYEVKDAIPYNAKLMADQGVIVAINSDDAEMGRRLNQEAAKAIKYGGMSEQDAWKMVTLNPAKLLHLEDRLGSIKIGKDADLVLWTHHPLSIEAIADKVFIDGTKFYDRMFDAELRIQNQKEKARIISKMSEVKKQGETTQPFSKQDERFFHCNTFGEEGSHETNCH